MDFRAFDHSPGNILLDLEDLIHRPAERILPKMIASFYVKQRDEDLQLITELAYLALDKLTYLQVACKIDRLDLSLSEKPGCIPVDHSERTDT